MAHDVTMPQLGMAQDSGVIVAWHKAPGDKVKKGEILFEVETDKAVMEVEAAAEGVVLELRRAEGEDVPVGEVLAVIGAEGETVKAAPAKAEAKVEAKAEAPKVEVVVAAAPVAAAPAPAPAPAPAVAPAAGGKVLASPKAKALAAEQGLDLNRLVAAGRPQPYRAADLELLKAMPAAAAAPAGAAAAVLARARVPVAAFDAFLAWVGSEGKGDAGTVLASFAAGAFRAATGAGSVTVRLSAPREASVVYTDPDRAGIGRMTPADDGTPDLIVHDLTRTRLAHVELGATAAPTLSIAREGDALVATLAAAAGTLDDDAVIACLDGFAGRLDEPLRHLL